MVDIGDTTHEDEGEVVQEPANDGVDTGVVDVVHVVLSQVGVATLPADQVEDEEETEEGDGEG